MKIPKILMSIMMMNKGADEHMNSILRQPDFILDRSALDADDYVTTLFAEGRRIGIATDEDAHRFTDGVAKLLCETIQVLSGGESTSVKQENAEKIVQSILYCVSVSLLRQPTPEIALEYLLAQSLEAVYYDGLAQIRALQKNADLLRMLLLRTKLPDRSYDYYRFIDLTVPKYLREYDPKTRADEGVAVELSELGIRKNVCGLVGFYRVMADLLAFNRTTENGGKKA